MNLLPTRAADTTRRNLRGCFPELNEKEVSRLAQQSLRETTKTALEMGKCWLLPIDRLLTLIREVEGEDVLEEARQAGRGVIILAPHLGNWEVFGHYFTEQYPTTFMYQPPRNPRIDAMIKAARSRGKARLAPTSRLGVAQLLKALRDGEFVGVLPDQEPSKEGGEFAPFFGMPALTMTLVSRLVQRTGARVLCGYARRLPRGAGFKLVIRAADPLLYATDLSQSVQGLNNSVEDVVRDAIPQYQWEYKRFKHFPDGSNFYRDP